jgi:hypothetical protein
MSESELTALELDAAWTEQQGQIVVEETERQARRQADRPGITIKGGSDGGETELISPLSAAIQSPDSLLCQHGMDPAEWEIIEVKAGQWESAAKSKLTEDWITTDLHQIRVRVRPKKAPIWIVPAAETSNIWTPKPYIPAPGRTRLTLVTTDLQVPFHDPKLHELSLHLAERIKPDAWVDLGDVLDLPMFSRWRQKPEFKATFNESITAGGKLFLERRQAVGPGCSCSVLWGNHDSRLRNWLLDHAEQLFDVRRAQLGFADDERSVLELDYLLRLDDSGWKKARSPWGEYPYECIWIAPGLAGVHGVHVRKGAGNSVRQEIIERDHSVIQGHVNKLAIYPYTRTSIQGKRTVWGIECGPMCLVEGSLGFGGQTVDWNPSLVTITTFPDGSFLPEPAPYINGVLSYRGMRLGHAPNGSVWVEA